MTAILSLTTGRAPLDRTFHRGAFHSRFGAAKPSIAQLKETKFHRLSVGPDKLLAVDGR
jgi:hypothetical protein